MEISFFCYAKKKKKKKKKEKSTSLGGLEPPTFRLTAERANRLRHRDCWKWRGVVSTFNHTSWVSIDVTIQTLIQFPDTK